MKIIAKTEEGYLISAKEKEVQEILRAVSGNLPDKIDIGQRLPAIDYATTITKVKTLSGNYDFSMMFERLETFYKTANDLKQVVENAGNIEL